MEKHSRRAVGGNRKTPKANQALYPQLDSMEPKHNPYFKSQSLTWHSRHTRSACEYTVYVFLFSNTASRVRIEITGLQVEGQVTTRVRDDSNTGASLWQKGQRHLVSFLLWNTHVDNTRVQIWSSCMSLICCSICYMYFRFRWTMPSARGPRRIMAHFKKRREYMSQVIHYTNRQCKLVQHTNIDINRYGDWGLPSVHQLRTHL